MKLTNNTPYPSTLEMGSTTDHEQLGTVACKVSYQWADDGELFAVADDAMWPVARAPELYDDVMLLPDADHRREGIDVLVFGDAVAPGGRAVSQMRVGVACGRFVRQFDVLGDRRWERPRADAPWRMSDAMPFERMSLGCDRAFGGSASFGGGAQAFSMNPGGRAMPWTPSNSPTCRCRIWSAWTSGLRNGATSPCRPASTSRRAACCCPRAGRSRGARRPAPGIRCVCRRCS